MYAEEVNYWKTSRSGTETWMERIEKEIEVAGGQILSDAFGNDSVTGRAAFMVEFKMAGNIYRAVWPVLVTEEDSRSSQKAAKVQAITALYHDIKNACVKMKFLGDRQAFFDYLVLPDGRTTAQASLPEMMDAVPNMLKPISVPQLGEPEIVDADYSEVE